MRTITLDWLSVYCDASHRNYAQTWYHLELQKFPTKHFKKLYYVYDVLRNEKVCEMQLEPHSAILPSHACIVKFHNRILYQNDWSAVVNAFLNHMQIVPISISRIDIAADFNVFDNNLQVPSFLRGFLKDKYLKNGRAKYDLIGEQKDGHHVEYLRFGGHGADVSVYLYNKSLELAQKKDKPYIKEFWKINHLDTDKDIWRLECSLKGSALNLVQKNTGEVFRLDLDFIKTMGIVENVYDCIILKYFNFKHNDGTKNKTRMKDVVFFRQSSSTLFKTKPTPQACSNKTDKMLLRKLYNFIPELRLDDDDLPQAVVDVLKIYLDHTGLHSYFNQQIAPFRAPHKSD